MKLFIEEVDTLDWVGKEYKVGMAKYSADVTFKRGGITYFIEFLDPYGSNMLAKWWDNSDNGVGYNNQGYVFVDNPFNRMTGYFSPENIDEYIKVDSDYGRKPSMSIQRILMDKVKRQLDYDALNDTKRTNESVIRESNAKMKEVKVLQGYYGHGWDDLEEVDADDIQGVKELKDDLKAYDENERYPHRIITRKVPNPDYDPSKARKSRDHGVMVTVADDYNGSDKEVYFTEDESIADQLDSMLIKSSWAFRDELRQDGYDFVKKNMKKLEKGEYEFRKRYSYYTYFLPDNSKPKTIISTYIDKRFVK